MKTCVECGCGFSRPRVSWAQWESRRFCGLGCYRANRRGRPVSQLNRPERVIKEARDWGQVLPFWRELLAVHDRVMQQPRRAR